MNLWEFMKKKVNLFLDDIRNPTDVTWIELPSVEWTIVRNYTEFITTAKSNTIVIVSFDHDISYSHYAEFIKSTNTGEFNYNNVKEKTGYHACKWLIEYCLELNIPFPEYYIHTMNPIGKANIQSLIDSYKKVC